MAYHSKIFVCFNVDPDIVAYREMMKWKQTDFRPFQFHNLYNLNEILDEKNDDQIKEFVKKEQESFKGFIKLRQLREEFKGCNICVTLIGEKSKTLGKFELWEIEQALSLNIPIIVMNLNNLREQDPQLCPAILRDELAIYTSFESRILEYALEKWPRNHFHRKELAKLGPIHPKSNIYKRLGL